MRSLSSSLMSGWMVSEAVGSNKSLHTKVVRHIRRGFENSYQIHNQEEKMNTTPVLGIYLAKAKFDVAIDVGQRPM